LISFSYFDINNLLKMEYKMDNEQKTIIEFFGSDENMDNILNAIPVRKLIHQTDKDFVRKMKKYHKEYGSSMKLFESQYKRIIMLKEEAENA